MPRRSGGVRRVSVPAFAKVNLSLKVLHKRSDGYHEIRSIFQTVGLNDTLELEFEPSRRSTIELDDPMGLEDNLVTRTARLFAERKGIPGALKMKLTKRIPAGGGLGGGSSDAAATLLALPALTGNEATWAELAEMAASLGSDVPFFLMGGTALGLGRGEELYPLPDAPARPVLILAPRLHVSTPEAYRLLNRPGLTSPAAFPKLDVFQSFVRQSYCAADAENDFEVAVFQLHPELDGWRRRLERFGAHAARLSGSGAALFGVFPDRTKLQGALSQFRTEPLQVVTTRLLSRRAYRSAWQRSLREFAIPNTWPPQSRHAR